MNRYRHPALKQFADQQIRFTPRERKLKQLRATEELLRELRPGEEYTYEEVCRRITDYRPDIYPDLKLEYDDLAHDLRMFIEDLSDSADLEWNEAGEPVLTVEDLSRRFNISTKTVNRWRDRGLVSRRFSVDGRKRVGFLESSVLSFVTLHSAEVDRGTRFSQLTEQEKEEIIRRARRMARIRNASLAEISRRIAGRMVRSPETVRYTIKNFDRENPDRAIFPELRGPLDDQTKQTIFKSYRRGIAIEHLAQKYHRTRASVHRIVTEMRAERLLAGPIEYMYHPSFDRPGAEAKICGPEPVNTERTRTIRPPADLPAYLQTLYEIPLLNKDQEQYLFRKMNYLLHRAELLRRSADAKRVKVSELDQIEAFQNEALDIKRRLIRSNLRLVVSIAKRHVNPSVNLFELISDGNVSLMRAVEKFDFSRNFKFSTYASWAIMKNFARTIPAENTYRDRFVTGHETAFDLTPDDRGDQYESELNHQRMQSAVGKILDRLDERERKIIIYRYGLADRTGPQTLEQVGSKFGVTKERIRQIEARAISKLRRYASEEKLDLTFLN